VRAEGGFELWGYPGAGKSTQARLFAERRDIRLTKLPSFAHCMFAHPIRVASALIEPAVVEGFAKSLGKADVAEARLASFAVRQSATLCGTRRTIIEEGLTHEIWRILFGNPGVAVSQSWQKFIPFAGPNIIVLEVEPAESLARILSKHNRGRINRELARSQIGDAVWERAIAAYDTVRMLIMQSPLLSVQSIRVDSLSPDEVSEKIFGIVNGWPSGRR